LIDVAIRRSYKLVCEAKGSLTNVSGKFFDGRVRTNCTTWSFSANAIFTVVSFSGRTRGYVENTLQKYPQHTYWILGYVAVDGRSHYTQQFYSTKLDVYGRVRTYFDTIRDFVLYKHTPPPANVVDYIEALAIIPSAVDQIAVALIESFAVLSIFRLLGSCASMKAPSFCYLVMLLCVLVVMNVGFILHAKLFSFVGNVQDKLIFSPPNGMSRSFVLNGLVLLIALQLHFRSAVCGSNKTGVECGLA